MKKEIVWRIPIVNIMLKYRPNVVYIVNLVTVVSLANTPILLVQQSNNHKMIETFEKWPRA